MAPTTSSLTQHLHEYLHEEPPVAPAANLATVLQQGQRAQAWLLEHYLGAWLEIVGGLTVAGYPRAKPVGVAVRLRQLGRETEHLGADRTNTEAVFYLESLTHLLRSVTRDISRDGLPIEIDERSMQWGIWAREVAMAVVCGFAESELLDAVVCESIAPCCMYAAYLVSLVVEDEGTAEEIAERLFETLPRELLGLVLDTPLAPEA